MIVDKKASGSVSGYSHRQVPRIPTEEEVLYSNNSSDADSIKIGNKMTARIAFTSYSSVPCQIPPRGEKN